MLDTARRFTITELPEVNIYPDHAQPTRFYAVPAVPRVARDAGGKPAISLLLYERRQGPETQIVGGQLMLTTSLGLTEHERGILRHALAQQPDQRPAEVDVLSPDWLDGEVEVRLGDQIRLSGKPSLMAANECALMASLTADQAQALRKAWDDRLAGMVIAYHLQTQAAQSSDSSAATESATRTSQPGHSTQQRFATTIGAHVTQAVAFPMTIEGQPALSDTDLKDGLQVIGY